MSPHPFERLLWAIYPRFYDMLWDTPLTAALADAVVDQLPDDRDVAEIGAGTGLITRVIAAKGLEVRASEPNPHMRVRLRRRVPGVTVDDAEVDSLGPRVGPPLSVVAVNVLHLLHDPAAGLARLRSRAGPGGWVVAVTPAAGAGVLDVAAAGRRAGVPATATFRFIAVHVLLSPLIALAQLSSPQAGKRTIAADDAAATDTSYAGIARIRVFPGT